MRRMLLGALLSAACAGCMAAPLHSTVSGPPRPTQMDELWEEPKDLARRDLFYGPWGKELTPNPTAIYTFASAKSKGVSPGFTVMDEQGTEWSVKQGAEAQVEVVSSRVLSALGYHQPPVYYLPRWTLSGGRAPNDQPEGRFRPKHNTVLKDVGEWSWEENPFVGARPYNGLRVLMMLLNQSDLKNSNNTLYEIKKSSDAQGAHRWYVVRDIGAGLGETGRLDPPRNNLALFERITFIDSVKDGDVRFNYHGRHQELADHLSPQDVRWMCDLLAQLRLEQWHDAFRAAGYITSIADGFIARIQAKIAEGQALSR